MKGAILQKGEAGYTYFRRIFQKVDVLRTDYNWLINDCEAYPGTLGRSMRLFQSGESLGLVEKNYMAC